MSINVVSLKYPSGVCKDYDHCAASRP